MTQQTTATRIGLWFGSTFALFFARAFMFSTWVARGPDVQRLLGLDTVGFGLITMLFPLGGLLGVVFAGAFVRRFGSRAVALTVYTLAAISLALLGPAITGGHTGLAAVLLVVFGAPMAIADFVGNYEGSLADKASPRSIFSAIHGAFGVGMLTAAALAGLLSDASVPLTVHYLCVAAVILVLAGTSTRGLPRHAREVVTPAGRAQARRQGFAVWREPRSLALALIGFAFVMAETSAGSWVPLALTTSGFTAGSAAFALSLFWVVVTIMRLIGGWIVDAIGRYAIVLLSALVTAAGLSAFMLGSSAPLLYLGLVLWSAGMAIGFPMTVASLGDDPVMAAARINMIIMIVYISNITVGSALGAVGQALGIYATFTVPLVLMLIAAALSRATKPRRRNSESVSTS